MVEFQKLTISRFMSFGEKQVVPLSNQGLVRLEGDNQDEPNATSNMAGKSSIIEALLWCLFGKTARGLKHDQVIFNREKKDCCVSVTFRDEKLAKYTVRRYRRHSKHKNHLQLWRGDVPLAFRHDDETQRKLEVILGCDFQSFVNSVIFGGLDLLKPFARLTDAEQKKLLESFLHFEQFDQALRRTKDLVDGLEEKLAANALEIEKERGSVSTIRAKIRELKKSARIFRKEYEQECKELSSKLGRLHKPGKYPSDDEVRKADDRVAHLAADAAKAAERVHSIQSRRKTLRTILHDRKRLVGKACPACGQLVRGENLKSFMRHVSKDREELKRKLRKAEHSVVELEKEVAYGRKVLKRLQHTVQEGRTELTEYLHTRRDLEARLRDREIKRAIASNPFAERVERETFRYGRHVSKLLLLEQRNFALKTKLKDLQFWEVGFGNQGVKALIVKQSLPVLNRKLKEYSKELFKGGVKLEFRPTKQTKRGKERELFHLYYKSKHGATSYSGESSGGRRRVDICVLLVFSWLSRLCNALFVDELLDGLDSIGKEAVLDILSTLRGTIICISHDPEIKGKFSRVWTVTKHHGSSTIYTGEAT